MKDIDFSGKVAVVTGAASGMGLMTAQEFARLGAKVVTVSDCVSGIGHNSEFGPQKLFDGLGMDGKQNTSLRWLAMYSFASNTYAQIEIPRSALLAAKRELV